MRCDGLFLWLYCDIVHFHPALLCPEQSWGSQPSYKESLVDHIHLQGQKLYVIHHMFSMFFYPPNLALLVQNALWPTSSLVGSWCQMVLLHRCLALCLFLVLSVLRFISSLGQMSCPGSETGCARLLGSSALSLSSSQPLLSCQTGRTGLILPYLVSASLKCCCD